MPAAQWRPQGGDNWDELWHTRQQLPVVAYSPTFFIKFTAVFFFGVFVLDPSQSEPDNPASMTEIVLFLCTGNYYRSRFAEILFNTLAPGYGLKSRAISRGLMTELISPDMGGISPHALRGLHSRKISLDAVVRQPIQIQESDLTEATLVIAMDEWEHRPMMGQRFPHWADRIQYWQIADIADLEPEVALFAMETRIRALLEQIKNERT